MDLEGTRPATERDLDLKRTELAALATDLVERELALAVLDQQLVAFRSEYLRTVGKRYAALDNTYAKLAEVQAARRPDDEAAQKEASLARQRADATAAQVEDRALPQPGPRSEPSSTLQSLYRTAALKLHPDLASTDDERALRRPWMRNLDDAYRREDEDAVKALLSDWEKRRESIRGNEVAGHLARAWLFGELTTDDYAHRTQIFGEIERLSRQILQAKQRMDGIGRTIDELEAGGLRQLFRRHRKELDAGRNLLDEMAAKLDMRIAYAQWEGSPPRNPTHDDQGLLERGLADLQRWRARRERVPAAGSAKLTASQGSAREVDYEIVPEQWSKVRPILDSAFLRLQRKSKHGQDVLREFVVRLKKALIGRVGLPKEAARAVVKRWHRETRGGRDVAPAETPGGKPGSGSAGPSAPGGTDADGDVGKGGTGKGQSPGVGGGALGGGTEAAGVAEPGRGR